MYSNMDNSNNNYILKYENFKSNINGKISYLTNNISISEFMEGISKSSVNYYNGAFFIPELLNRNQVLCDNKGSSQYLMLDVGKTISIPLLFEYFLTPNNDETKISISKTLAFDVKPSLIKDPDHFILTMTAKYDYSQTLSSLNSYNALLDGLES